MPFFGGGVLSGRGAGVPPRCPCPPRQVASIPRLGVLRQFGVVRRTESRTESWAESWAKSWAESWAESPAGALAGAPAGGPDSAGDARPSPGIETRNRYVSSPLFSMGIYFR